MARFLFGRLLSAFPTLLGASLGAFFLVRLTGDPALLLLPPNTPPAQVEVFRELRGFNDTLPVQYWHFLTGALRGG